MKMNQYNNFFNNKVVIITGCASDVGQKIGEEFSKLNARIVCVDTDSDKTDQLCQKLESLSPNNYTPLKIIIDLNESDFVYEIIDKTIGHFHRIDVLVNNAGVLPPENRKTPSVISEFDKIIAINLRASFHLSNLSFKHLSKTKGSIINVWNDNNFTISNQMKCVFNISKAAFDAMTQSLSQEWSSYGIRVNSVNLGHTLKMKFDEWIPRLLLEKLYPIKRFGRPIDVENAVVFLASDLSAFINGFNLEIDGGYHNIH